MDSSVLADLADLDIWNSGGDENSPSSSLLDDVFAGHHNPLSDTDLDSLLSSLSPSSTNSSSSPQQQNTNGEDEDEHDELSGFKIESLLDFVLEDNNNQLEPTNNTGLEDHDYTMVGGPATENTRQDLEREIVTGEDQNSVVQDILNAQVIPQDDIVIEETIETQDILTQNSWSPYVTSEEEMVVEDDSKVRATNMEEIKDEVVIQTVKLPVKSAPSSRKYITILPAAQKPKISLVSSNKNKKSQGSISNNSDSDSGVTTVSPVAPKRRRVQMNGSRQVKFYPPLMLTEEEKQLCQKDGIVLPEYYPLTKAEESDLRKIRRKIRNKLSAQRSRGRKKEYVDDMEARATVSETENKALKRKVAVLESQNKTLIGQLQRMKALLASATTGTNGKTNQKSSATALMVLLLSTALFAIPGFKEQYGGGDTTDLTDSLAMATNNRAASSGGHFAQPPRTSRSLLHYIGKGELGGSYPNIPAAKMDKEPVVHKVAPKPSSKWAIEDMVVDDTPNFMDFGISKERAKQELMDSLNYSREFLQRQQRAEEASNDQNLTNKTKIVTATTNGHNLKVKPYTNHNNI